MEVEQEGVRYKVHSGPKKPFRTVISILLFLSFMFGLFLLKPRLTPTGRAISTTITFNWLGMALVGVPLILIFFWLKKQHSLKKI